MKTSVLRKMRISKWFFVPVLLLSLTAGEVLGGNHKYTTKVQGTTQWQGSTTFNISNIPFNADKVTLKIYYKGYTRSLTNPTFLDLFDEDNNKMGSATINSSCPSSFESKSFTIAYTKFRNWLKDGSFTIRVRGSTYMYPRCSGYAFKAYLELSYPRTGPDNAGIVSIDSPALYCPGTHNIVATAGNLGSNYLNNIKVTWAFNGVTQSTTTVNNLDTFGSGNYSKQIVLGSKNFPLGKAQTIKVWTHNPNGNSDTFGLDDSKTMTTQPSLGGKYTIGGSNPDYKTFSAAKAALDKLGVCKSVEFDVRAGTYYENLTFLQVVGASNAHSITFKGRGIDSTKLDGRFNTTLKIASGDYYRFKDMSIEGSARRSGMIEIVNRAEFNKFINCGLKAGRSFVVINNSDSNYFFDNEMNGGRFAIDNSDDLMIVRNIMNSGLSVWDSRDLFVQNNMINGGGGNLADISIFWTNTVIFRHNSFTGSGRYLIRSSNAPNLSFYNNNFKFTGTDAMFNLTRNSSYNFDFNNYDNQATSLLNKDNSSFPDLAAWKKGEPWNNQNSWAKDANYKSGSDLHLNYNQKFIRTLNSFGLNSDVDGDSRCLIAPSVGADESQYPIPKANARFTSDDIICHNSPVTFLNGAKEGDPFRHYWYVNDSLVSSELNFTKVFTQQGYDTIKLITQGCSSWDTAEKVLYVAPPNSKPITKFLSDRYVINVLESVELRDLSMQCLSRFKWEIFPDSTLDPTSGLRTSTYDLSPSDSDKKVNATFFYPGTYKVCLTTWNKHGKSKTLCKEDYITVNQNIKLCFPPSLSKLPQGNIFDDGGVGFYSDGQNCSFLLNPCASEIRLEFKAFDVREDDYLRIYDGKDANGKKLWDVATFGLKGLGNNTAIGDAGFDTVLVAKSGSMYFEWETVCNAGRFCRFRPTNGPGFKAEWSIKEGKNFSKPAAKFSATDTACPGLPVKFENQSTGKDNAYEWFSGLSSNADAYTESFSFIYHFAGTYTVKLVVNNCGGTDTFEKVIHVVAPSSTPNMSFSTSMTRPAVNKDIARFVDGSYRCVDFWNWGFKRSNDQSFDNAYIEFKEGTGKNNKMPGVVFKDTGYYDVRLIAGNSQGSDTLIKQNYIYAHDLCIPGVAVRNPDIGITHVMLGNINQKSDVSSTGYTDYTATQSSGLSKGVNYNITIKRNTTVNKMNRKVWIDYNQDGDFEPGELVVYEKPVQTLSYTGSFTVPGSAKLGGTRLRIGVAFDKLKNEPCNINRYGEFEDYRVVIIPDQKSPVLSLVGNDTVEVEQCYSYYDSGATALDNVDGPIDNKVSPQPGYGLLDTCKAGTYTIKYTVQDAAGNNAIPVERTVIIYPDQTDPVITITGGDTSIPVFSSYNDPGATALDNIDGNITNRIRDNASIVDTASLGTYVITYRVKDYLGNEDTAIRKVTVYDSTAPVMQMIGGDTAIEVFGSYTERGVKVSDNYWPLIPQDVTVKSNVDTATIGTYQVIYEVADGSGNKAVTLTRKVEVVDTEAPVLSLDEDTVILDVFDTYMDPGVAMTDNYSGKSQLKVQVGGSFVAKFPDYKPSKLGTYELIYTVTDGSGNSSTIVRIILVMDRVPPVISLKGNIRVNVTRWEEYVDSGYTVRDNYYPVSKIEIDTISTVLTDRAGEFYVRYKATDPSGNTSMTNVRDIIVNESNTGIEKKDAGEWLKVYPNPGNGNFHIEMDRNGFSDVRLSVYNSVGKEIWNATAGKDDTISYEIDLTENPGAVYTLKVKTSRGVFVRRLVVVK